MRLTSGAILFFVFLLLPSRAFSTAATFNMIRVHPNADLGHYFFVQESSSLPQLGWNLGTSFLYYNEPLKIKVERTVVRRGGTTTTTIRNDGTDNMVFEYFYGALGITDYLSVALDWPLFLVYDFAAPQNNVPTSGTYGFKPGDINLSAKLKLLDLDKHPVGIAIIPSVTFPTGKEEHFLGDDGFTGEARVVIEVKPASKLRMAFNAAYQTREKVDTGTYPFRDMVKMSLGANYQVAKNVSLIAEAETQTATNDFYGSRHTSPAEARVGARWNPNGGGWLLGLGGSVGIIHGSGMPRYAGFVSVGYTGKGPKPKPLRLARLESLDTQKDCERVSQDDGSGRYLFVCSVYFGFDKAAAKNTDVVTGVVEAIKNSKDSVTVEVRGFADPVGKASYNRELSKRRARFVASMIKKQLGADAQKTEIRVLGIGEDRISPRARARRTDMLLK